MANLTDLIAAQARVNSWQRRLETFDDHVSKGWRDRNAWDGLTRTQITDALTAAQATLAALGG